MFDYDTRKAMQVDAEMPNNNQSKSEPVFKENFETDSSCFSTLQKTITQNGKKRIDLDILDDTKRYCVDEYFKLLKNPDLEKKELTVLDKADKIEDNVIIKQSVEKAFLVCDLIDKFQDDPENVMIQYINKAIELNGEDFLANISFNENNGKKEMVISDGENFITFDTETSEVTDCSAASPWGIIPGTIIGAFDGNTKDGQIGDTKQGGTGDCWLLSGVNSLSYTEEGRKIIKDALEYHDGYTIVHLATGDYVVQNFEVTTTKGSEQYSSGDDDMIIFELAVEKALDEIANGEVEIKEGAPWYFETQKEVSATEIGSSSTEGGYHNWVWYLVSGKTGEHYDKPEDIKEKLFQFEQDNSNLAIGAIDRLHSSHAWAVKEVKDGIVTITDPSNSSIEKQYDIDTFISEFYIQSCDLSEKNHEQDFTTFNVKDENGNIQNFEDRKVEYNKIGIIKQITYKGIDKDKKQYVTAIDTNCDGVIDKYEYKDISFDEMIEWQAKHENKEVLESYDGCGKFCFLAPTSRFYNKKTVILRDKNTGEILVQYYDENDNLRAVSRRDKDNRNKEISNSIYNDKGEVEISVSFDNVKDENGKEYWGPAHCSIYKNGQPNLSFSYELYLRAEDLKLFENSNLSVIEAGCIAMQVLCHDKYYELLKEYLEENPNATFSKINDFLKNIN